MTGQAARVTLSPSQISKAGLKSTGKGSAMELAIHGRHAHAHAYMYLLYIPIRPL